MGFYLVKGKIRVHGCGTTAAMLLVMRRRDRQTCATAKAPLPGQGDWLKGHVFRFPGKPSPRNAPVCGCYG